MAYSYSAIAALTSVTFYVYGLSEGDYVRLMLRREDDPSVVMYDIRYVATDLIGGIYVKRLPPSAGDNPHHTYFNTGTPLEPNTEYRVNVYVKDGSIDIDAQSWTQLTSRVVTTLDAHDALQINMMSYSETSASVYFNGTVANTGTYYVRYGIEEIGIYKNTSSFSLSAGNSFKTETISFSGLSSSTAYTIWCGLYTSSGSAVGVEDTYGFVTDGKMAPDKWSWYFANSTTTSSASATDAQTANAYAAILNKGAVSNFNYCVWNDLVNKVNEVVEYFDSSWSSTYGSLSATKMSAADKTMTAQRYNAVYHNLSRVGASGLSSKVKGEKILGSYFTDLTNAINRLI